MSDLPDLPHTPAGLYRHHKGGEYEVVGVARHSETLEALVVYRPRDGTRGWWVRPHAMFFEAVIVDGWPRPRFERLAGVAGPAGDSGLAGAAGGEPPCES